MATATVRGDGKSVYWKNQTGSAVSLGDVVAVGKVKGIVIDCGHGATAPNTTIANASSGEVAVAGKIRVPKLSTDTFVEGDRLYWDAGNLRVTVTKGAHAFIGLAATIGTNGLTYADVILNGGGMIEDFGNDGLATDIIAESTSAAGVTIDGALVKDKAFSSMSPTAAKGSLKLIAADSAGDTVTQITNASQAAARVYTVPDAGADAEFLMSAGDQTLAEGKDLTLGTATGTKLGTAVSQKLGFWNATPIVQPAAAAQAAIGVTLTDSTGDSGTHDDTVADALTVTAPDAVTATSPGTGADATTWTGAQCTAAYTDITMLRARVNTIVTDLTTSNQNVSDLTQKVIEVVALVNAMQSAMVTAGLMKGGA